MYRVIEKSQKKYKINNSKSIDSSTKQFSQRCTEKRGFNLLTKTELDNIFSHRINILGALKWTDRF